MTTRRRFLAGLAAASALPRPTWADAGAPAYLAAARDAAGAYRLCGLSDAGAVIFDLPLPDRGHAAAAHPTRPEAIAFARRPGTFALVIDCAEGRETRRLTAPPTRHFYGHGAFSSDGRTLYTTENDLDTLTGVLGVWDAAAGYARLGEIPTGGTGPHEVIRLPGTDTLVVANGGIETHPDSGRAALNPATMRASLAYVDPDSGPVEVVELSPDLRQNSIRHLAARPDGTVAAAMQWQGDEAALPPLLMTHRRGADPRLLAAPEPDQIRLRNYAGSVAISGDGAEAAITSPRGGVVHRFRLSDGAFLGATALADVCGVARAATGFFLTTGTGRLGLADAPLGTAPGLQWDNHVVAIGGAGTQSA